MEFDVILKNFFDEEHKLTKYPSKHRPRMTALMYVAAKFQPDKKYNEAEVNAVIDSAISFGDICFVRRELIDWKFLSREKDGSAYWLADPQPTAEKLGIE